MTFSPLPADPFELYALMGVETLLAHCKAIVAQMERAGVEITGQARLGLDELEECVVEHYGRNDVAALKRHLGREQGIDVLPAPTGRRH